MPVSYTHLDVYKRQSLDVIGAHAVQGGLALPGGHHARAQARALPAHLDVYKRQALRAQLLKLRADGIDRFPFLFPTLKPCLDQHVVGLSLIHI